MVSHVISRIAPTPSGYLHEGNLVNFLATHWLVDAHNGTLALRIDDMDRERYRRAYVEDIFRLLDELGIHWSLGPRNTEDFEQHHSLRLRTDHYRTRLREMRDNGLPAYVCACSRVEVQASGGCVRSCVQERLPLVPGQTALRAFVGDDVVSVGGSDIRLRDTVGDFVIWRRDDQPSYQLASLIEDDELGTTHIVRGRDLLQSSAAQLWLARHLADSRFPQVAFIHHELLLGPDGNKLSKSQLRGGPLTLDPDVRARVHRAAANALGAEPA